MAVMGKVELYDSFMKEEHICARNVDLKKKLFGFSGR
jgi:hypothetical protein